MHVHTVVFALSPSAMTFADETKCGVDQFQVAIGRNIVSVLTQLQPTISPDSEVSRDWDRKAGKFIYCAPTESDAPKVTEVFFPKKA